MTSTGHASFASFVELWTLLHPCPYCQRNRRTGIHWRLYLPDIPGRIWHIGRLAVHHSYNRQLEHEVSHWSSLMGFLAQLPRSPRDLRPEKSRIKNQGKKIFVYISNIEVQLYIKLNQTNPCMHGNLFFPCSDLVTANRSVKLIHFLLKENAKYGFKIS